MRFFGKFVTIRAFEHSDAESLARWANDPETQDGIGEIHFPSSKQFHTRWVDGLADQTLNHRFAVELPSGHLIGLTSIMDIDWRNRRAWHGVLIGESSARGNGYGKDAIMATMRYAFDELNLNRLDSGIIEYNSASLATYCGPTVGWRELGRRHEYFFRKGQYWDQILIGVTRSEYELQLTTSGYWNH